MRRAFSRLFLIIEPILVSQAFVLHSQTSHTCLSRIERPYAAPSPTYRSWTFGGGDRQWRCILGRTILGRAIWSCLFIISLYTRQSSAKSPVAILERMTSGSVAKRLTLSRHISNINIFAQKKVPLVRPVYDPKTFSLKGRSVQHWTTEADTISSVSAIS